MTFVNNNNISVNKKKGLKHGSISILHFLVEASSFIKKMPPSLRRHLQYRAAVSLPHPCPGKAIIIIDT